MEATGWAQRRARDAPAAGRDPTRLGRGCECTAALPRHQGAGQRHRAKMNEDGTVVLLTGAAGLGTGAHTALAQIVAEELCISFDCVSVVHGDTDVVPWDIGAFASHTTYMVGRAAQMAAGEIKTQLLTRRYCLRLAWGSVVACTARRRRPPFASMPLSRSSLVAFGLVRTTWWTPVWSENARGNASSPNSAPSASSLLGVDAGRTPRPAERAAAGFLVSAPGPSASR